MLCRGCFHQIFRQWKKTFVITLCVLVMANIMLFSDLEQNGTWSYKLPTIFRSVTRNEDPQQDGSIRMHHRQELTSTFCHSRNASSADSEVMPTFRRNLLVSQNHHLLYCPVGKAASTFLTRFFIVLAETNTVLSPYIVPPEKVMRMRNNYGKQNPYLSFWESVVQARNEKELLGKYTRIVFVRNPFQRLLSAYVDKLLFPNPYYWKSWGLSALNASKGSFPFKVHPTKFDRDCVSVQSSNSNISDQPRLHHTRNQTQKQQVDAMAAGVRVAVNQFRDCGQNVEFSQFVRYVIDDLHLRDPHVRPISLECSPCYVNYNVIGRVESLVPDVLHLVRQLNLSDANLRNFDWKKEMALDAIRDAVNNLLVNWFQEVTMCISEEEAGQRLWHVLQIRGIISRRQRYPFCSRSLTAIGTKGFETALRDARARSMDDEELPLQAREEFQVAYSSVSARDLDRVREVYKDDFQMFNYDAFFSRTL